MARQSLLSVLLDLNADGFEKGLNKAQRSMRGTARALKRSGAQLTRNVTAPLGIIGATSFKVAADFEAAMAKVKAVSGATAQEFKALEKNALDLGRSTRFSASEVASLQLEFSKLGFTADEIEKVTGATLNLAQATGSDLAQSAEVAGSTLRAFGLDASETSRVTDVMAASFSSSALDMGSFQDSMKFVAPVARAAGIGIEETTAMLAALANNGIKGSQAGTALRRIISTLGSTGGDVAKSLAELSNESLTLGGAQDEVGRNAQSALLVLTKSMGAVGDLTSTFQNANGAAAGMARTMDDTAEGSLKRMQSAVEGMQISIGTALAPVVLDIVKEIEKFAQGFSELSKGTQGFIVKLGLAAAAIGPFKSTLGSLLMNLAKSDTATKLLSASMRVLNTVMKSNPVLLVASGIAALVGALIMLKGETDDAATATDKLAAANKGLSLEEQKRNVEEAIEKQQALVDMLEAEKDAKQAIVDEGFGGKAQNDLNKSTAAFSEANAELKRMQDLLASISAQEPPVVTPVVEDGTGADVKPDPVEVPVRLEKLELKGVDELPQIVLPPVKKAVAGVSSAITDMASKMVTEMDRLNQGITDAVNGAAQAAIVGFSQMLGAGIATGQGMKGVGSMLLGVFADLAINLGSLAVGYGIAIEKIKVALSTLQGPVALAAGIALIALGAGLKGAIAKRAEASGIPALREGGMTTGPTLAMIGDNPSGREAIVPFEKMGQFVRQAVGSGFGGNDVNVHGRIDGRDLVLVQERGMRNKSRFR